MKQWILQSQTGIKDLKLFESSIPEVSSHDVLVKFHADSLNYRDIMIADVGPMIKEESSESNTRLRAHITGQSKRILFHGKVIPPTCH